jgi:hypothetical protein
MADPCTDCPEYVKATVRAPVQLALDQLKSIIKLSDAVNEVLDSIASGIAAQVGLVVDAIPDPPLLDLSEITDLLTCPLTPIALFLNPTDLAALDPRELFTRTQAILVDYIEQIISDYETALAALTDASVVAIAKRYFDDLKRIQLDAVNYGRAIGITAFVETTCPEEFDLGPYAEFDALSSTITLDDLIPDSLGVNAKALMDELQRAENKFLAWRALSTANITF